MTGLELTSCSYLTTACDLVGLLGDGRIGVVVLTQDLGGSLGHSHGSNYRGKGCKADDALGESKSDHVSFGSIAKVFAVVSVMFLPNRQLR